MVYLIKRILRVITIRKIIWTLFILATLSYALPNPTMFGINITFADLLYVLSFYLICMYRLTKKETPLALFNRKYISIWMILLLIGVGCLLGLTRSENAIGSISNLVQYVFIFVVLLTVIEFLINKRMSNAIKIAGIFLIPNIIVVLIVLFSKFGIVNIFDDVIISYNGRYRGFDGIATEFGSRIGTAYAVVLFFLRVSENVLIKIMMFLVALSFGYVTLLSGSFSSALILFAATIGYFWFVSKHKKLMRFASVVLVLLVSFIYYQIAFNNNLAYLDYAPDIIKERFISSDNNFGSAEIRGSLNTLGVNEFIENPVIGVGYGQFKNHNAYDASIHNTFISVAAEMGIFGLMGASLYVFMPYFYSRKLAKSFKGKSETSAFINFLSLYALIRILNTLISQEFINRELWVPVLLIFVIYASVKRKDVKVESNQKQLAVKSA